MSLSQLLNQTVSIKNPTGALDKHGKETLAAAVTYRARFQKSTRMITTPQKEREPIDGIIFLPADATVKAGAQLTYNTVLYRVLRVDDIPGRNGNTHHFEVMAQLWSYA